MLTAVILGEYPATGGRVGRVDEWRQDRKAEAVNCTQMQIQGSNDSLNPLGIFCLSNNFREFF